MHPGLVRISFGLIITPEHAGWPVHAGFALRRTNNEFISSPAAFSKKRAHDLLREMVEEDVLTADEAAEHARAIDVTSLPDALTRYDRIALSGLRGEDKTRLIEVFAGVRPAEEGSGPARFERCFDGKLCSFANCNKYAAHGKIFPKGLTDCCEGLAFSSKQALTFLALAVDAGIIEPSGRDAIVEQIDQARLANGELSIQADRLTGPKNDTGIDAAAMLDVIFGLQPGKPPRFERNGGCFHLLISTGTSTRACPTVLHSKRDARRVVQRMREAGVISKDETSSLLRELDNLALPETSDRDLQSREELAAAVKAQVKRMWDLL